MKQTDRWYSSRLGTEVSVARWGEVGVPFLIYPTAGGDFEEIERFVGRQVELVEGRVVRDVPSAENRRRPSAVSTVSEEGARDA